MTQPKAEPYEIDECRMCGRPRAEHVESRAADAPVPKTPCLLLLEHFVARVVQDAPERPPAPPLLEAYPVLRFFAYEHLPPKLQAFSKPIADLALTMATDLKPGAETAAGLRKLLEAKDCFVRAALP